MMGNKIKSMNVIRNYVSQYGIASLPDELYTVTHQVESRKKDNPERIQKGGFRPEIFVLAVNCVDQII